MLLESGHAGVESKREAWEGCARSSDTLHATLVMVRLPPRMLPFCSVIALGCSPSAFDLLESPDGEDEVTQIPSHSADAAAPVQAPEREPGGRAAPDDDPAMRRPSSTDLNPRDAGVTPVQPASFDGGRQPRLVAAATITHFDGRALEVTGFSTIDNAPLQLAPLQPSDEIAIGGNQRWKAREVVLPGMQDVFQIENVYGYGMCLDKSYSAGDIDGAAVYIYRCRPDDPDRNQLWQLRSLEGGFQQLVNMRDGRCLQYTGDDHETDVAVQAWTCRADSTAQRWRVSGLSQGS
jgi:hypothetical protein